jgi:hypothetical protein
MLRKGLGSTAGWMDWRNKLSPDDYAPQDTLALLGMAQLGSAPAGSLAANGARRFTLSRNLAGPDDAPRSRPGQPFYYHIMSDGEKIGSARGSVADDIAYLSWLGATGQDNALGVSGVRQLREAMRRDFPGVQTFEGNRSSGASAQDIASKLAAEKLQSVKMK